MNLVPQLFGAVVVVIACSSACSSGDDTGDDTSDAVMIDAPTQPDGPAQQVDGPAGTACTGVAYDPCTTNDQCMSGNCKLFMQSGFTVCTQACTPGDNSTCPAQGGAAVTCNNMGVCKPTAPNTCTR